MWGWGPGYFQLPYSFTLKHWLPVTLPGSLVLVSGPGSLPPGDPPHGLEGPL